jgi:hypothetical protein
MNERDYRNDADIEAIRLDHPGTGSHGCPACDECGTGRFGVHNPEDTPPCAVQLLLQRVDAYKALLGKIVKVTPPESLPPWSGGPGAWHYGAVPITKDEAELVWNAVAAQNEADGREG